MMENRFAVVLRLPSYPPIVSQMNVIFAAFPKVANYRKGGCVIKD